MPLTTVHLDRLIVGLTGDKKGDEKSKGLAGGRECYVTMGLNRIFFRSDCFFAKDYARPGEGRRRLKLYNTGQKPSLGSIVARCTFWRERRKDAFLTFLFIALRC